MSQHIRARRILSIPKMNMPENDSPKSSQDIISKHLPSNAVNNAETARPDGSEMPLSLQLIRPMVSQLELNKSEVQGLAGFTRFLLGEKR